MSTLDIMVVVNITRVLLGLVNIVVVVGAYITKAQAGFLGIKVTLIARVGHLGMLVVTFRVLDSFREEHHTQVKPMLEETGDSLSSLVTGV